jgi:hypothetical protein
MARMDRGQVSQTPPALLRVDRLGLGNHRQNTDFRPSYLPLE